MSHILFVVKIPLSGYFEVLGINPAALSLGPLGQIVWASSQLMAGGKISDIPQGGPSARNFAGALPSALAAFLLWSRKRMKFSFSNSLLRARLCLSQPSISPGPITGPSMGRPLKYFMSD